MNSNEKKAIIIIITTSFSKLTKYNSVLFHPDGRITKQK